MIKSIRVGIAQINPIVGDYRYNREKIVSRINEAEKKDLDWIVFPEGALCGYPVWDLATRKRFVKEGLRQLEGICRETKNAKVLAVVGYIDEGPRGAVKNYNALAVISRGKVVHKQYKTLLPTYDVFLEQIFFTPAREQKVYDYRGVRVGMSICEDIWDENYSVKPVRILADKGARVIVNISASPFYGGAPEVRDRLISRKARETGAYLIYVNQVGGQDDLVFDGRSLVADPRGDVIFRAAPFKEALNEVTLVLAKNGNRKAGKRVALVKNTVKDMYEALVLGVKDYVEKNGFTRVVIGLSGGIDSALTAALAADAVGPDKVIGVAMPGEFSSQESLEDARDLAKRLGIGFRVRPISDLYHSFIDEIRRFKREDGLEAKETKSISLAMENLQARLRGLELMYISNDEGVLLLSTGNKSELATGYCTLYGDMSGGLCVLGDVYKTDVYRLANWRNGVSHVIPQRTIEKAPTAELRPDQKDQDTLPPYDILDEILLLYIEKNCGKEEICRRLAGRKVERETVEWVIGRVEHNEYKRRQAPPILRVTEKAWFGRRMPITNHYLE